MEGLGRWPESYSEPGDSSPSAGESHNQISSTTDGASEPPPRRLGRKPVTAIFVHAGAGFHSLANEKIHLEACSRAATMGMKFLQAGASATETVVAVLKVLEDREITNAGYGSNINIEGTVECDATVVDHDGRSGACGAVPNMRNPISLAKLILDKGMERLSLGRVPPNFLVGEGAREFGRQHGMMPVSNENMISKNARDRFIRWQEDLKRAQPRARKTAKNKGHCGSYEASTNCEYETNMPPREPRQISGSVDQPDHTNAIATGVWNEGQPDSPYSGSMGSQSTVPEEESPNKAPRVSSDTGKGSRIVAIGCANTSGRCSKKQRFAAGTADGKPQATSEQPLQRDGSSSPLATTLSKDPLGIFTPSKHVQCDSSRSHGIKRPFNDVSGDGSLDEDMITDTVGCVVIDDKGRIAAGSSSGGIGMKHRGRIGPAALVGIGTAVVPSHPSDPSGKTVACVMSGTGEHMATTLAAQRAAERIYNGTRRGSQGEDVPDEDEHEIMKSFVTEDFMRHPGVMNMSSTGAVGVVTVKKCVDSVYFFFAHNTESFALASLASTDKEPLCLMSRLGGRGNPCSVGARRVNLR